jgi:bifunctional UDP-N-acetylglucosamine pyrophosphorylase/glucosamine-1-phosphate N-acetyltransferase
MHSSLPKVLHQLGGRSLLEHVLDAVVDLAATTLDAPVTPGFDPRVDALHLVVGFGAAQVRAAVEDSDIPERLAEALGRHLSEVLRSEVASGAMHWHLQQEPRGTGHALLQAAPALPAQGHTLVLFGDVPLIESVTLRSLLGCLTGNDTTVILTAQRDNPYGYGRILRNAQGDVVGIVEQRDASAEERGIREVNSGVMLLPNRHLSRWLGELSSNNAQAEYYLTDVVAFAHRDGLPLIGHCLDDVSQIEGVNTLAQLIALERVHQRRLATRFLAQGVCIMDPERIDVRGQLRCGHGVRIDVNCVFEGTVELGDKVSVGANCVLINCSVANEAQVLPFTHCEGARIGPKSRVGPYARLRPGTELGTENHVGNFVEIKATRTGAHTKANHLAYLGDALIGERVNLGAGTITCNYDGANKHLTVIEDDAFIGSDTQLVAPVRVGAGATLGAGTTLTRNAPAGELTVSRARQQSIAGWKRPRKRAPPAEV